MRFFREHQDNIHQVQSSISIKHFCGIKLDCNQVMPNASRHSRSSKSWNPQRVAYQRVQHQQSDHPCAADHIRHPQQHTYVIPTYFQNCNQFLISSIRNCSDPNRTLPRALTTTLFFFFNYLDSEFLMSI